MIHHCLSIKSSFSSCVSISSIPISKPLNYKQNWGLNYCFCHNGSPSRISSSIRSESRDSSLSSSPSTSVALKTAKGGVHTGRDPNVKKPEWLRQRAPQGERFEEVKESLSRLNLNTVCQEAQCPNIGEVLYSFHSPFFSILCLYLYN